MRINCSHCGASRTVPSDQWADHANFITCENCGRKIKTVRCPGCGTAYSITFDFVKNTRYRVNCKKCLARFIITFPESCTVPPAPAADRPDEALSPSAPKPPAGPTAPKPRSPYRESIYTINGFLRAVGSSFTRKKILPASLAVAVVYALGSLIGALLSRLPLPAGADRLLTPFTLSKQMLMFFVIYLMGSALVAGITLDETRENRRPLGVYLRGVTAHVAPIAAGAAAVLLLIELAVLVFGSIPLVGTLLYALLFIPVYGLSLAVAAAAVVGFWFYAPIMARHRGGFRRSMIELYRFTVRHNFSLLFNIAILAAGALAATGFLYLLHSLGLAAALGLSRVFIGPDASGLFSSMNPGVSALRVIFSSVFMNSGSGQSVLQGISIFIIGLSLTLITVVLAGIFISIVATISTRAYDEMEEQVPRDEKSAVFLLGLLVMLLVLLFLARWVLPV